MAQEESTASEVQAFLLYFPEFADVAEARLQMFLELAQTAVPDGHFGSETKWGRALYAAHHLAVLGSNPTAGSTEGGASPKAAIASQAVGSVNVSYDQASSSETDAGFWNSTGYGRLYWGLVRRHRLMPFVMSGRATWP